MPLKEDKIEQDEGDTQNGCCDNFSLGMKCFNKILHLNNPEFEDRVSLLFCLINFSQYLLSKIDCL